MAVFSQLADTPGEVRLIAANELGLRDDLGIQGRALAGLILTCWEAAQSRLTRRHTEEADQRAVGLPRRLPAQEHAEMLNACEDAHSKLKEEFSTQRTQHAVMLSQLNAASLEPQTIVSDKGPVNHSRM